LATQSFQLIRTRIWHYKKGDIYAVSSKTAGTICALDYFVNMGQAAGVCQTCQKRKSTEKAQKKQAKSL